MRRLALLCLTLTACECGPQLVSTACRIADDCGPAQDCRDGECVPVATVDPVIDAGPPPPPMCGTKPACGDVCCAAGETCRDGVCLSGCAALSCDAGSSCSPDLVACVEAVRPEACEDKPAPAAWQVEERWHSDPTDSFPHTISAPVVLDVDGDGAADVITLFFPDFGFATFGKVRALSGRDGHLLWETAPLYVSASALAVGVIDGQRVVYVSTGPDVVQLDATTGLEREAGLNWCGQVPISLQGSPWGTLGLVNFGRDGGGPPESYCYGSDSFYGAIPVAFDNDAKITAANRFGSVFGFPAVADLARADGTPGTDFRPELAVSTGRGQLVLLDPRRALTLATAQLPGLVSDGGCEASSEAQVEVGGAPAVADVDGDGQPDIAVAGSRCLSVFSLTDAGVLTAKWSRPITDLTSGVTAVSAFDFDADGRAELLQLDEQTFRIIDGATGADRFSMPHCSATAYDMPVVADLDGDGRAEVLVPVNTFARTIVGCPAEVTPGLKVLHEKNGQWANARPVWNQHTYHRTNVCDGEDEVCGGPFDSRNVAGAIPDREPPSWSFPGYNGYRLQSGSGYDAPNFGVSTVAADTSRCPSEVRLSVRVENRGMRVAAPGVTVEFLAGEQVLGRAATTQRLNPGGSEIISTRWAPGADVSWPVTVVARVNGDGAVRECRRDDNQSTPLPVRCE